MATNNAINSSSPVVQIVGAQIGTLVDCSAVATPIDDTIPQSGEGVEVLTLAITPRFSTSNLLIEFAGSLNGGGGGAVVALFQDATAGALAAKCYGLISSTARSFHLQYIMVSGTTIATTFKIRIGGAAAGTFYLNGNTGGGQLFDGVGASFLTITEYI